MVRGPCASARVLSGTPDMRTVAVAGNRPANSSGFIVSPLASEANAQELKQLHKMIATAIVVECR